MSVYFFYFAGRHCRTQWRSVRANSNSNSSSTDSSSIIIGSSIRIHIVVFFSAAERPGRPEAARDTFFINFDAFSTYTSIGGFSLEHAKILLQIMFLNAIYG